jgi:cyclomaltodextrinase
VALNLSGEAAELAVPKSAAGLLAGRGEKQPDRDAVSLPAYGWAVLGNSGD